MTKEEIYSVFDGGDPEPALMKLAVSFPRFGRRDLEQVLLELLGSGVDHARPSLSRPGPARFPAVFPRSHRDDAFRTIFFIMFKTDAWDAGILTQPGFLDFVGGLKRKAAMAGRQIGRSDIDVYEAFAEMEDLLAEKIRRRPEGAACLR